MILTVFRHQFINIDFLLMFKVPILKRRFMNIFEKEGWYITQIYQYNSKAFFSHDQHLYISRKKKDLLWYYRGLSWKQTVIIQFILSQGSERDLHEWQQATKETEKNHFKTNISKQWRCSIGLDGWTGTNIKATLNCGAGRKRTSVEINQVMYEMARAHIAAPFPRDINRSSRGVLTSLILTVIDN